MDSGLAVFKRKDVIADYEVKGKHFKDRASAEFKIKELLKTEKEVVLYKNKEIFAVYYKQGNDILFHKVLTGEN